METRNDEAVLHNRELQRIRQQKYQGRLKEKDQPEQRPKTPQKHGRTCQLSDVKTGKENDSRTPERKCELQQEGSNQQETKRCPCCKMVQEDGPSERTGVATVSHINSSSPHSHPPVLAAQHCMRKASSRFRRKFLSSLPAAS